MHATSAPQEALPEVRHQRGADAVRVEHLRHLGWQPYTVQSFQSWFGHTQEN